MKRIKARWNSLALPMAIGACFKPSVGVADSSSWAQPVSGLWADTSMWTSGIVPNSTIDADFQTGSTTPYSATILAPAAAANLIDNDQLSLVINNSQLSLSGALSIGPTASLTLSTNNSTGSIVSTGEIDVSLGGNIDSSAGSPGFVSPSGLIINANQPSGSPTNVSAITAAMDLGTGNLAVTVNQDPSLTSIGLTLSGPISAESPTSSLNYYGDGIMRLNGSNTYLGPTLVHSGTFVLGASSSLASSNLNISSGATATLRPYASIPATTDLTDNGTLNLLNPYPYFNTINGSGLIELNGNRLMVSNGGTFSGSIMGGSLGGNLNVSGGAFTLTGLNDYAGATEINGGTLNISSGALIASSSIVVDGNGKLIISGTIAVTGYEYLGNTTSASVVQNGGINQVAGVLDLGYTSGVVASYTLTSGTVLVGNQMYLGNRGTAVFNQSGGTVTLTGAYLTIGEATATGTYVLSGTGSLTSDITEEVGYSGTGRFNQSGGSNTTPFLDIAQLTGGVGTYNLTGTGSTLTCSAAEYVGDVAKGTFNQSGGTNTVGAGGTIRIAEITGSIGTFLLSGTGIVSSPFESVGFAGTGTFNQSGGQNTITTGLFVGDSITAATGTYLLSNGVIIAAAEFAGENGTGLFNQSGGTNNVSSGGLTVGSLVGSRGTYLLGANAALNVTGNEIVGLSGTGTFSQTSGTHVVTGTLTLAANNGSSGTYNLQAGTLTVPAIAINAGGILNLSPNAATGILIRTLGTISLNGTTLTNGRLNLLPAVNQTNRELLVTAGLNFAGTPVAWKGLADLANNDVDIQSGSLANISSQVLQGFNNGNWNGPAGVISSSAASDSKHLTAIGIIQNNQSGAALYTASNKFDGIVPGAGDILLKYTYYGDTELIGKVDASDYSRIDAAFVADLTNATAVTGWFNGDFNYDGLINGSDYTLIDNAFDTQGAQLSSQITNPVAGVTTQIAEALGRSSAAVPEPTSLGMLSVITVGLLGRRRR